MLFKLLLTVLRSIGHVFKITPHLTKKKRTVRQVSTKYNIISFETFRIGKIVLLLTRLKV